jgi:ubiquinone/menaquinone biosynthesis C-methylase UbiE
MAYNVVIERNHSMINDEIIAFLKAKLGDNRYLDIGTNTGYLLEECPNGAGCDYSVEMVEKAKAKGLDVCVANALDLPYPDKSYPICVLSCVLEQIEDPYKALSEAFRVASQKVIGVSPYPDKSTWGKIGGTIWVKSVVWPDHLVHLFGAHIEPVNATHYFFEIQLQG